MAGTPNRGQSNAEESRDPNENDDQTQGYDLRSVWINLSSGFVWTCVDTTPGAAVWKRNGGSNNRNNQGATVIKVNEVLFGSGVSVPDGTSITIEDGGIWIIL